MSSRAKEALRAGRSRRRNKKDIEEENVFFRQKNARTAGVEVDLACC